MDGADLNVLRSVLEWRRAGQRVVLFSVVQTWGTAPRAPVRCSRCARTAW
jgi:xanthine dehydrogenase accessory factor